MARGGDRAQDIQAKRETVYVACAYVYICVCVVVAASRFNLRRRRITCYIVISENKRVDDNYYACVYNTCIHVGTPNEFGVSCHANCFVKTC